MAVVMPIATPVLPIAALPDWCGVRGFPPIVLVSLLLFLRLALGPPHWTVSSSIVLAPPGLLVVPALGKIINPKSHALNLLVGITNQTYIEYTQGTHCVFRQIDLPW